MPTPLLAAYIHEMPAIQAEQSLRRVTEVALGSGRVEQRESQRLMHEWQREARGGRQEPVKRQSFKAGLGGLAAMGIPVKEVQHG